MKHEHFAQWLGQSFSIPPTALQRALHNAHSQDTVLLDSLIHQGFIPPEQRPILLQSQFAQTKTSDSSLIPGQPPSEGMERYEILEEIGSGGMGRVFRARVKETGIPVVIKTLLSKTQSQSQVERFHREGMALARLSHPNIARVYDFRLSDSQCGTKSSPYLVMEHIQGVTLAKYLDDLRQADGFIDDGEILEDIFAPLCDALIYCHESGIIHRDVKPENILIEIPETPDAKPRPVLVDFGLVRIDKETLRQSLELSQQLTQSGQFMGSPAFSAPEQLLGETELFSPALDVWGLAATLYWTVSGHLPYDDHNLVELLATSTQRDPLPLKTHHPKAPRWLNALCVQSLKRQPEHRLSMSEFQSALNAQRNPRSYRGIAAAAAILAFLLTIPFLFRDQSPPKLLLSTMPKKSTQRTIQVSGQIFDDHPKAVLIARRKRESYQPWKSIPVLTESFTAKLELNEGLNEFLIWAEDENGLRSDLSEFSIELDTTAPELYGFKHASISYEKEALIEGKVDEPCTLTIGALSKSISPPKFQIRLPLKIGRNKLTLKTQDELGNSWTGTLLIERRPVLRVDPKQKADPKLSRYKSLEKAIQAAPKNARLVLAAGVHDSAVIVRKPLQIIGEGSRNRVLLRSPQRPLQLNAPKIVLKNVRVENHGLQGWSDAVQILADNCILENCEFYSKDYHGVNIGQSREQRSPGGDPIGVKGTIIRHCEFSQCGRPGLSTKLGCQTEVFDTVFQNNDLGAFVAQGAKTSFERCQFVSNVKEGIRVIRASQARFKDCVFRRNRLQGLRVQLKSRADLQGCELLRNGRGRGNAQFSNIRAESESQLFMNQCITRNSFGSGLRVQDSSQAKLSKTQVIDNRIAGINARFKGRATLNECELRGNRKYQKLEQTGGVILVK